LASNPDSDTSFFNKQDFFRVFMFVKRDRLARCHDVDKKEKILRVSALQVTKAGWNQSVITNLATSEKPN
jgi:hypothetical protein